MSGTELGGEDVLAFLGRDWAEKEQRKRACSSGTEEIRRTEGLAHQGLAHHIASRRRFDATSARLVR